MARRETSAPRAPSLLGAAMSSCYDAARRIKNASPILRRLYETIRGSALAAMWKKRRRYKNQLAEETRIFRDVENVNDLPPIFHYWSDTYVRPMLEEYGCSNPDQFFAKYLRESARQCGTDSPVFLSIGAGNCDTEVRVAKLLKDVGLSDFVIECLDMNPHMLRRGREMALREGVENVIVTVEGNFNEWKATKQYAGVMANQSLHHVLKLEHVFGEVKGALDTGGYFVVADIVGRNGHLRWPEALVEVHRFWRELPAEYRYNRPLERFEEIYENWDCSSEGFEGIRAQDILPLLLERFDFHVFLGFANVVDVFVDRNFGHNFDADKAWDRALIDRIHAFDEQALHDGTLTPTHMMAVMTVRSCDRHFFSRGLSPARSVRKPRATDALAIR